MKEKCPSQEFINLLKDYGSAMFARGEMIGQSNCSRSKKYAVACDLSEQKMKYIIENYSPKCTCSDEELTINFNI